MRGFWPKEKEENIKRNEATILKYVKTPATNPEEAEKRA